MKTSTKKKPRLKRMLGIAALCLGLNATITAQCHAGFTYTVGSSGSVSFTNTSTVTTGTPAYGWYFSDGSNSSVASPTHTFIYNGTYNVNMYVNTGSCFDSTSQIITITNGITCNITAGFSYSLTSGGQVNFTNTSTNAPTNAVYSWSFGDGSTSNLASPSHTYNYNGSYTAYFSVSDSLGYCSNTTAQTFTVSTGNPCSLSANYTYTLGSNGQVVFTNTTTGADSATPIYWSFGDGSVTNQSSPSHTYAYKGTYNVTLQMGDTTNPCYGSYTNTVTITNVTTATCVPSVSFYMINQDSIALGMWGIVPNYSSQVSGATWYWGDGTSTSGLYPNHNYASPGAYNICVTVFSTCGDSSNVCQHDSLFRLTNSMIQVNVLNTTAGIKTNEQETAQVSVYPNPSAGVFTLQLNNVSANTSKAQIDITNILGEVIYTSQEQITNNTLAKNIDLQSIPNGAYFMKVIIGDKTFINKIIISK